MGPEDTMNSTVQIALTLFLIAFCIGMVWWVIWSILNSPPEGED